MTNLQELFEVFNGQDLAKQMNQTLELFKTHLRDRYLDLEDSVNAVRVFCEEVQAPKCPYRITYNNVSLSLKAIQNAFSSGDIRSIHSHIALVKSELMHCADQKNLKQVKDLFLFFDAFELSIQEMMK